MQVFEREQKKNSGTRSVWGDRAVSEQARRPMRREKLAAYVARGRTIVGVDGPEVAITDALHARHQAEVVRRIFLAESQAVWRIVRSKNTSRPVILSGVQASSLIVEAARLVDQKIRERVTRYSAVQWLWMLRRIPHHVFEGNLSTTAGYDQVLAETLTGGSPSRPSAVRLDKQGMTSFDLSRRALTELAEHCARTQFLSDLHIAHRWACKGARVEFRPDAPPRKRADDELVKSVRLYDRRTAAGEEYSGRIGTILLRESLDVASAASDHSVLHLRAISPIEISIPPEWFGAELVDPQDKILTTIRFNPEFSELSDLMTLGLIADQFQAALVFTMHAAAVYALRHRTKFMSLLTRGYQIFDRRMLAEITDSALSMAAPHIRKMLEHFRLQGGVQVLDAVKSFQGSTWPLLAGPILRFEGNKMVCLDLANASRALETVIEPSPGADARSNLRAEHFEKQVQQVLDDSDWKPLADLRELRGRTLRLADTAITDVDAVGCSEATLLLISCKSFAYRGTNDIGNHSAIRNRADDIVAAVNDWNDTIELLRNNPKGDNYDFSGYTNIVGLVCTAHLHWVPLGIATSQLSLGLFAACSISELKRWLAE